MQDVHFLCLNLIALQHMMHCETEVHNSEQVCGVFCCVCVCVCTCYLLALQDHGNASFLAEENHVHETALPYLVTVWSPLLMCD